MTGNALRYWRQVHGFTQDRLGQAVGCYGQTISDLERGKKPMPLDMQARLQALEEALP
jgi:transcriptional regulator with XRE-family HTH domain